MKKLLKKLIPTGLFTWVEPIGHLVEAAIYQILAGFPARKMNIIGVTGTDGKSTTATMIATMLLSSGKKVAVMTTISTDFGDGRGEQVNPDHMTTPSSKVLIQNLKRVKAANVDWVVLETSSHALAQHRVFGVPYSIAVFTNLSHEHLDYHKTFKRYRDAKRLLFKNVAKNRNGQQLGIINADDENAQYFIDDSVNTLTYGLDSGELRASNIVLQSGGSSYDVKIDGKIYHMKCNIPGRFNVYNSLAAVSVGKSLGLSQTEIEKGIASLTGVAGRMNVIKAKKGFHVYIDYAVTPAALENVLGTVKETTKGSVRLVFGATGDRDKKKRPIMGRIAAELADFVYLTDDETHTEDPASIRAGVFAGIVEAGGKSRCREFDDRGDAIKAALTDSVSGDSVVITGLGHQTTRNMKDIDEPWSDSEFVQTELSKTVVN
jgi:UDP-N-acetylmuramoyl-L-alanyl-D-glutamate--2,6-diaminopimelate ligase